MLETPYGQRILPGYGFLQGFLGVWPDAQEESQGFHSLLFSPNSCFPHSRTASPRSKSNPVKTLTHHAL